MIERGRQNVMLMVSLQLAGWPEQRARVRDISAGGLKVSAPLKPAPATTVRVELPGLGWIAGEVAWSKDSEFGIRFAHEIDPAAARKPVSGDFSAPQTVAATLRHVA